jgi:NADPH2:quinone reductase
MKAIEIIQSGNAGDAGQLQMIDLPVPVPRPGEMLIRVHAAGVNRPDVLQRRGRYHAPTGASEIPGLEVAGVVAGGELEGSGFRTGDKVCALLQGGGYAEYCTAPVPQCLPVPEGLTFVEAAALPETFFTVWSNIFDRAAIRPGETLLVQGGTSGIGVAAIQIATVLGHRVFATARTPEKCQAMENLGAVRGINYMTEDFVDIVKRETGGKGVDVILDIMGAMYLQRELDCMAEDGRLVMIAHLGGRKGTIDFGQLLHKRLTVTGSTLRPRSVEFKGEIAKNLRKHIWPLLESGAVKAVVDRIFPLDRVMQAHELMESSNHIGKIVLQMVEGDSA